MVEQRTENPCVTGSIPVDATSTSAKWQNGENCFAIFFLWSEAVLFIDVPHYCCVPEKMNKY
jgi:hypothetical protein